VGLALLLSFYGLLMVSFGYFLGKLWIQLNNK
jgi:hypothetical protein